MLPRDTGLKQSLDWPLRFPRQLHNLRQLSFYITDLLHRKLRLYTYLQRQAVPDNLQDPYNNLGFKFFTDVPVFS